MKIGKRSQVPAGVVGAAVMLLMRLSVESAIYLLYRNFVHEPNTGVLEPRKQSI